MTAIQSRRIGGNLAMCPCGAPLIAFHKAHQGGVRCVFNDQEPEGSQWHCLTIRQRLLILAPLHELMALTHWLGIRDRLRCPSCKAVGTWKMHGALLYRWIHKDISVRRWLCKWCGHYIGPKGRVVAYPDLAGSGAWALPEPGVERQPTPAEALKAALGKCWPWVG